MNRRIFPLLILAIACWGCRYAYAVDVTLPIVTGSSVYTAQPWARLVGLTPINPSSVAATTTSGVGDTNVTALNAYFSSGWATDRLGLSLAGRRIGVTGTVVIANKSAQRILTTGMGDYAAFIESEYGSSGTGGLPTGLVWINRSSQTGPVLSIRSFGFDGGHLRIDGNFGTSSRAALVADTSHRVDKGVEVQGQQGGVGVGKVKFDSLTIANCVTGLYVSPLPAELNADASKIETLRTTYCDVGLHLANEDAVGWKVGYYDATQCPTGILFAAGGDFEIGTLVMQTNTATGVSVTANDTQSSGAIIVHSLLVDAQAPTTCHAIDVDCASGNNAQVIDIGWFRGQPARTAQDEYFDLSDFYGELNVESGTWLVEGSVGGGGGTSDAPQTVRFRDCRFIAGSDLSSVRKLFTTEYRGYVNVVFEGCRSVTGHLYPAYYGTINVNSSNSFSEVP